MSVLTDNARILLSDEIYPGEQLEALRAGRAARPEYLVALELGLRARAG